MTTRPNHAVQVLLGERDTIAISIDKLQADLKEAKAALRSLDDAISQLTGAPAPPLRPDGPTLKELVLDQLDEVDGKTPLEIANAISVTGRETTNTSVSSILSRLRADGLVDKNGDKWSKLLERKGPDAPTSEPFDRSGPVTGRGTGFPSSTPEGSIPSGSTVSHPVGGRRAIDLDDEIPF